MMKWLLGLFNQNTEPEDQYIHDVKVEEYRREPLTVKVVEEVIEAQVEGEYHLVTSKENDYEAIRERYSSASWNDNDYKIIVLRLVYDLNVEITLNGNVFNFNVSLAKHEGKMCNKFYIPNEGIEISRGKTERECLLNFLSNENREEIIMDKLKEKVGLQIIDKFESMRVDELKEAIGENKPLQINFTMNVKKADIDKK